MKNLYEKGYKSYPKKTIFITNSLFLVFFVFAAIGMLPLRVGIFPVFSLTYLFFVFFVLILGTCKHLCTHCYYHGKLCGYGWGKFSSLLFQRNSGNFDFGSILCDFSWKISLIAPLALILIEIFLFPKFIIIGISCFTICLIMIFLSLYVRSRYICSKCKRKNTCIASISKD